MQDWMLYGVIGLAVFGFAWALGQGMMSQVDLEGRQRVPGVFQWFYPAICFFGDAVGGFVCRLAPDGTKALRKTVKQSGYDLQAEDIYGAMCFFGGLLTVAGVLLRMSLPLEKLAAQLPRMGQLVNILGMASWGMVAVFGLAGLYYPFYCVRREAEKRNKELMRALPFAIDLLASIMSGGLDFVSAVRYLVSSSRPNLLVKEFGVFLSETELGKSRSQALHGMAERLGMPEFSRFVSAISFGVDSGVPIQGIMKAQGEEIRRVRQYKAEEQAQKVPEKMLFPSVLFILPAVFLVIGVPLAIQFWDSGVLNMLFQFMGKR